MFNPPKIDGQGPKRVRGNGELNVSRERPASKKSMVAERVPDSGRFAAAGRRKERVHTYTYSPPRMAE
ncbi:hypothetical protein FoTM2_006102 [Fusarium oxysporum f. sp. vasinfectum]|nr:hypothetical protein FoTM2_006102 [Fusarium oxysporum f. sp. vasinfectum]